MNSYIIYANYIMNNMDISLGTDNTNQSYIIIGILVAICVCICFCFLLSSSGFLFFTNTQATTGIGTAAGIGTTAGTGTTVPASGTTGLGLSTTGPGTIGIGTTGSPSAGPVITGPQTAATPGSVIAGSGTSGSGTSGSATTPTTSEPTSGSKMNVNVRTLCVNHSEDGKMYGHVCGDFDSQEWRYDTATNQIKNFRNRQITCVDAAAGKGQPVTLRACNPNIASQKFDQNVWDNVGFKNISNGLCLDIPGGWAYDKEIGLWDCNQGINQRFFIA